jgi:pyruvate carboxylase subunit B
MESIKMEINVLATRDGVIKSINVALNDKVVEGQIVAVLGI